MALSPWGDPAPNRRPDGTGAEDFFFEALPCTVGDQVTWTLPTTEHQTFDRNPLVAVICQLRFDPILKVHEGVPDLQDKIRARFPGYQEAEGVFIELTDGLPRQRAVRQHRFTTKGERTVALLADQAIALEYRDHLDREVLLNDAQLVFGALEQVYRSVSPQRLGLRYVNAIDLEAIRRDLGKEVTWRDVVTEGFIGIPTGLADHADTRFASETTSRLDPGQMTVRMGLLPQPDTSQLHFRLDVDRYTEEDLGVGDVEQLLRGFVDDIYNLFRAAAGTALIEWMEAK